MLFRFAVITEHGYQSYQAKYKQMEMNTVVLGVSNFHFLFRIPLFTFSSRLIQQVIHTDNVRPIAIYEWNETKRCRPTSCETFSMARVKTDEWTKREKKMRQFSFELQWILYCTVLINKFRAMVRSYTIHMWTSFHLSAHDARCLSISDPRQYIAR